MLFPTIASVALGLIGSAVIVPIARNLAIKRGLLDIPNERSSHKVPTPRTGGVGIVAGAVAGIGLFVVLNGGVQQVTDFVFIGVLLAGAAVGFFDDIFDLRTLLRMGLYLACAAGTAIAGAMVTGVELPGLPVVPIGFIGGLVFSALFIAWYTNLFNFMDGIDGIAAGAAIVALGALSFLFLTGGENLWGIITLASVAATLGFLKYNFPPATVFMGDGGAVFLGLQIGALSLLAVAKGLISLPAVVLLMLPFVFDATFTLIRRVVKRERFWSAHRSHVYQQMCDLGMSHRSVSLIYTGLAVVFASLGLAFESMPIFGQAVVWWGALAASLAASLFVISKNSVF